MTLTKDGHHPTRERSHDECPTCGQEAQESSQAGLGQHHSPRGLRGYLELDAKVELIRSLVPLGLMHVQELLDEEVTALARERYARKDASVAGRRHGSNPGTVGLAGQRVPIRVPRIRRLAGSEIPLRSYEALHGDREVDDVLLRRVLYGISCRNYEAAAAVIPGAIGLSSSTVSRGFIQASAAQLRAFQERDLSGEDVVAVFLDGKTFADATMVIALGITLAGERMLPGSWGRKSDALNATVHHAVYKFGRWPSEARRRGPGRAGRAAPWQARFFPRRWWRMRGWLTNILRGPYECQFASSAILILSELDPFAEAASSSAVRRQRIE